MSFRRMRHVKAREFQGCDIAYDFSNPANLYDATTGGALVAADGAIARANDVSGNTGHMLQSISGSRPLRKVAVLNGLDAAQFDGSSDYLNAGDVADMLANPVEFFVIHKFNSATPGVYAGIFIKGKAAGQFGQWGMCYDKDTLKKINITQSKSTAVSSGGPAGNTNIELLHGTTPRTAGTNADTTTLTVNGKTTYSSAAYTADTSSANTTHTVFLGVFPDTAGTAPFLTNYFAGYIGEAAKFATLFTSAQRRRLELSRCRKWRIAS